MFYLYWFNLLRRVLGCLLESTLVVEDEAFREKGLFDDTSSKGCDAMSKCLGRSVRTHLTVLGPRYDSFDVVGLSRDLTDYNRFALMNRSF